MPLRCHRRGRRRDVIAGLDPQRLDVRAMVAFTLIRGFVAMELQQIQRYGIEDFVELATAGVDEQAHGGHERRQRGDDRPRLLTFTARGLLA
jgi:hypothetical protein